MSMVSEFYLADPNPLAADYTRFRVCERMLMTGHSHQAWPDCAFSGQMQAYEDAAAHVDAKWERAFSRAQAVREGYRRIMEDPEGGIALAPSTHDLLLRFLSALPLDRRRRLVTTDGEFHTIRRQLDRLGEGWMEICRIPADPVDTLCERLAAAIDDSTAAVLVSAVFYRTGRILRGLDRLMQACGQRGAELLVDAYHALNVVPFPIRGLGLENAFVLGGGYKYCQLGEGNCMMRYPAGRRMRPVLTGWFAEFGLLSGSQRADRVEYGPADDQFAGSTYDPTSHYRAAEVFSFFRERGLTPDLLRRVSRHQIGLLARAFDSLDLDPDVISRDCDTSLEDVGGFLVLQAPRAGQICRSLAKRGVLTDSRGDALRFGPAPYLSDRQIADAMGALREAAADL